MQRHSFDFVSAGFGTIFIWVGVVALIPELAVPASTIWPVLAVAAGVAVLASAIRNEQQKDMDSDDPSNNS